ncbi:DUF167 domain-containing protein [Patescibacteria group bacterium]|nr:DUF167 domain-containing protein [Patescibacteria group bacterium]
MKVRVKAHPKSKKQQLYQLIDGSFEVWVHDLPVDNRANEKIAEMLAEFFKVPKSSVVLKSGASSKNKIYEIN